MAPWDLETTVSGGHVTHQQYGGVDFSADGSVMVRASGSSWAAYDTSDWSVVGSGSDTNEFSDIAVSPDGTHLVVTDFNWFYHVYEVSTGNVVAEDDPIGAGLAACDWSPDGDHVAVAGFTDSVAILDVNDGYSNNNNVTDMDAGVDSVAFSPSGRFLAIGSEDGDGPAVFVAHTGTWSVSSGDEWSLGSDARRVAWGKDGVWLAAPDGGAVEVYTSSDWEEVAVLNESAGNTWGLAWSADGAYVAADHGGDVWVYETEGWTADTQLTEHTGDISDMAFSAEYLAYQGSDGVYVFEAPEPDVWSEVAALSDTDQTPEAQEFSEDSAYLAVGTDDENVYVYDTSNWSLAATLTGASGNVQSVSWSSSQLAYAEQGGDVFVHGIGGSWPLEDQIGSAAFDFPPYAVDYSPDGSWLYVSTGEQAVSVYETTNYTEQTTLPGAQGGEVESRSSRGGSYVMQYDNNSTTLYIYNEGSWTEENTETATMGSASKFSLDGDPTDSYVAYTDESGPEVVVLDTSDWSTEVTFTDTDEAIAVAFSPDGDYIAYGDVGLVVVREVGGGWPVVAGFTAAIPSGEVNEITFSPDGNFVAYGDRTDTTHVHSIPSTVPDPQSFAVGVETVDGQEPAAAVDPGPLSLGMGVGSLAADGPAIGIEAVLEMPISAETLTTQEPAPVVVDPGPVSVPVGAGTLVGQEPAIEMFRLGVIELSAETLSASGQAVGAGASSGSVAAVSAGALSAAEPPAAVNEVFPISQVVELDGVWVLDRGLGGVHVLDRDLAAAWALSKALNGTLGER